MNLLFVVMRNHSVLAKEELGFCHQVSGEDDIPQGEETSQGLGGRESCPHLRLVGSFQPVE